MRVLIATHSRDRGSTSRTLEGWVHHLPAHGIDPVVTIGGSGPLLDVLASMGVVVHVEPIRVFPNRLWPVPFARAVLRYARLIRRLRPSLIHVNEHEHYPVVGYAARLTGTPTVVHIRFRPTREHCAWLFKRSAPERVFFTSETQMRQVAPLLDGIVPETRRRLLRNAVDLSSFRPDPDARARLRAAWGLDDETCAVGTASSISPRKRLDHFIAAIRAARDAGAGVHGFIAGMPYFDEDHRELARLERLVQDLGLTRDVTFLGYVEPVKPLYDAFDICLSTSEYESFGMTVLESMSAGCPVVAYPGGAVEEVLDDAGLIVSDGDQAALTSAVLDLTRSVDRRRQLAERGRDRAAQFDIRRATAELAAEYHAVGAH
jgi:glycosyltransferase involved in cell wall biosynthesis